MSKHKALELADCIEAGVPFDEGEIVEELRAMHAREQRQHALIVQMREALRQTRASILGWQADEPGPMQRQMGAALLRIKDPLAAADQYLEGQA